ncbi:unnamed protein product [Symbiodinium sp. CCMP2592]|nr:unnamed protein product [Symbiodinium sp. CCMP2592]
MRILVLDGVLTQAQQASNMRKISERNCCWDEAQHSFCKCEAVSGNRSKGDASSTNSSKNIDKELASQAVLHGFGWKNLEILGPDARGIKLLKQPHKTYRPQKML